MSDRPDTYPDFALAPDPGMPGLQAMSAGEVLTGFQGNDVSGNGRILTPGEVNWLMNRLGVWTRYHGESIASMLSAAGFSVVSGSPNTQLMGALQFAELSKIGRYSKFELASDSYLTCISGQASTGGNNFVAGGAGGRILRAEDISYVAAAGSYAGDFVGAIAAGASFGNLLFGDDEEIQSVGAIGSSSPASRNTGGTNTLRAAAYNPTADVVLIVGDGGTIYRGTAVDTWTDVSSSSANSGDHKSCQWSEQLGLYIIAGSGGIQTTPDGLTFTQRDSNGFLCATWVDSAGLGVAFDDAVPSASKLYVSTDAVTWSDSGKESNAPSFVHGCAGGVVAGSPSVSLSLFQFENGSLSVGDAQRLCPAYDTAEGSLTVDDISYDSLLKGFHVLYHSGNPGRWMEFVPMPFGV